jgi:hypothetical protein
MVRKNFIPKIDKIIKKKNASLPFQVQLFAFSRAIPCSSGR